jgi:hypothetical protein
MSLAGFSVIFLVLGCLLVLVALLGGAIGGNRMRSPNATRVRILVALVGVVLAASPYLYRASHVGREPAAAAAAPAPEPVKPQDPMQVATTAIEKCSLGTAPAVPDAASASLEQMEAARTAFQAYDAAMTAYEKCVDDAVAATLKQFPDASSATQDSLKTLANVAHNTAINQEQAVADGFNAQVRAFKAKHPAKK